MLPSVPSPLKTWLQFILMQSKEIKKLEETINQIKQYIEVYETYIEGWDANGHQHTRRSIDKE